MQTKKVQPTKPRLRGAELLHNLQLLETVNRRVAVRRQLRPEEGEEILSIIRLKLIEGKLMNKFRGDCNPATFFQKAVERTILDYWIGKRGKWRPSLRAQKAGSKVVEIERLVYRERYSVNEALQILRNNHGWRISSKEADELAAQVPRRQPRRFVGEDCIERLPANGRSIERQASSHQRQRRRREIERYLKQAFPNGESGHQS